MKGETEEDKDINGKRKDENDKVLENGIAFGNRIQGKGNYYRDLRLIES